jgi:hypothetical protein
MLDKTNIKQRFSYNLAREHYKHLGKMCVD